MATTTNYGWTTPDDTALVKDGASAIRTLGTSVDTTTKNLNPQTTLGDIAYRSSTSNVNTRLGIGSTGQVLTVAAGVPAWSSFSGGKVLQVVGATSSTATTIATTTYTDTTLTATITPTSATSKILVLVTQVAKLSRAASGFQTLDMQLLRGASVVYLPDQETLFFEGGGVGLIDLRTLINIHYYDAPATTSATTYKTQGRIGSTGNSGSSTYQSNSRVSSMTLLEIGA
jgi:hypothetical protein